MTFDENYHPDLKKIRDGEEVPFAEGGLITPKKKHHVFVQNGEWVMNKKTIQDRINGSYNGR